MFLTSSYVLIVRALVKSGFIHILTRDNSQTILNFLRLDRECSRRIEARHSSTIHYLKREFTVLQSSHINPLSAKQSFQLRYPGDQRLKVISFSWSWVKSPSKCFSNAEPTTIIASRDEKRCNASVQWTRLVHSRSLRLGDQHRKCHGWLLFFAVPDLHPDQRAAVQPHAGK